MSDVQTENAPVTQPEPGLEAGGHTESTQENPPVTPVDPTLPVDAGAPQSAPADLPPAVPGVTDSTMSYIREELLAVVFGIKSGVNNGIERAESLIRHVESLL